MKPRDLPAIDRLMNAPALASLVARHGPALVKRMLRDMQNKLRAGRPIPAWAAAAEGYAARLREALAGRGYRPVHNLTGTLMHSNLGRAPLSGELWDAARPLMTGAMNLEYDLERGGRGDREGPVAERLARLTGAPAAALVNNNAAALMLVLNTFALGRQVPVSRGELIEIGGSFRLPEIMERAGCRLLEVGATNRTHLRDFAAVAEQAALFLKVHPSNYRIAGYASEASIAELSALASERGRPLCVDLGSGALVDLRKFGLPRETTPREALAAGAQLVTFSGDKLLGGPQSGLIVGQAERIAELQRNPLKRALRLDKIALALLDATLKLYEQPDRLPQTLPLLRCLTAPLKTLEARADQLRAALADRLPGYHLQTAPTQAQIGSGALPDRAIPSRALVVRHAEPRAVRRLAERLRALPQPVLGRLQRDALWLDLRGALDWDGLLAAVAQLEPAPIEVDPP